MIVDAHAHYYESRAQMGRGALPYAGPGTARPWEEPIGSPEVFDRAMEVVDHAFVLGFESRHLGISIPAAKVATVVARQPAKYIGFAGVDPGIDDWAAQLDEAIDLKLRGVVISPAAQLGHRGLSDRVTMLCGRCAQLGLPIIIQPGWNLHPRAAMEYANPVSFDDDFRNSPQLRAVLACMGEPYVEVTLALLAKHEHIYADLAGLATRPWQLYQTLLMAYERRVMDKLLLGSGYPLATPQQAMSAILCANDLTAGTRLPRIPGEFLQAIVQRDALACLGIPSPRVNASARAAVPAGATSEIDPQESNAEASA